MTEEQIALARRAVACSGWKWMAGMLSDDGFRVCRVDTDGYKFGYRADYNYAYSVVGDVLPDLTDPATLGCLLALVREAWGDPEAHIALGAAGWVLMSGESRVADVVYPSPAGRTEAEALVAALEATP